ncbi:MAG: hypothetical protein JXR39_00590 [Marinilabiliaceae bacterium]|nr:hypothetical protein [Marinilabiliaceae bacterium]
MRRMKMAGFYFLMFWMCVGVLSCSDNENEVVKPLAELEFVTSTFPSGELSVDAGLLNNVQFLWANTLWEVKTEVLEGVAFITSITPTSGGTSVQSKKQE